MPTVTYRKKVCVPTVTYRKKRVAVAVLIMILDVTIRLILSFSVCAHCDLSKETCGCSIIRLLQVFYKFIPAQERLCLMHITLS